jgi:predicted GNAT family N-acyltransferase
VLRLRVLREPLGLGFTEEQLTAEAADLHLAAFAGTKLVGCMVLSPVTGVEWKMRQVAVELALQGHSIGSRLVAFAEQVAVEHGCEEMTLHARATAVSFYLRLGYHVIGAPFEEVTLPHVSMMKRIAPPARKEFRQQENGRRPEQ